MNEAVSVVHVDRLQLTFAPKPWAFAHECRAEIAAYFESLRRLKPAVWNGRVLLLHEHTLVDRVFRGAYLETDYASFAAWRYLGRPAASVCDCFGAAAIVSADGAFLLGVMGSHTANAGCIYFPCAGRPIRKILSAVKSISISVYGARYWRKPDWTWPNSTPSQAGRPYSTCR